MRYWRRMACHFYEKKMLAKGRKGQEHGFDCLPNCLGPTIKTSLLFHIRAKERDVFAHGKSTKYGADANANELAQHGERKQHRDGQAQQIKAGFYFAIGNAK